MADLLHVWEIVAGRNECPTLERARVPGGWLYRTKVYTRVCEMGGPDWYRIEGVALQFVPDTTSTEVPHA